MYPKFQCCNHDPSVSRGRRPSSPKSSPRNGTASKRASPPTIRHDGRCPFPGFKRTADKQRMGETRRTAERWQTERQQPQTCLDTSSRGPGQRQGILGATDLHLRYPGPDPSVKKYLSRSLCFGLVQRNHGNSGGQVSLVAKELGIFWYRGKDMARRNSESVSIPFLKPTIE